MSLPNFLEVIQTLASLPKEYDVRFFHVERSSDGVLTARLLPTIDVKLLSDLGVDIRNLEMFKRFIVVEGKEDEVFIESLLQRYGRRIEDVGYVVIAGNKNLVKHVSAALTSTKKDVIAMLDYDTSDKDSLINDICNILRKNYNISLDGNTILINGGQKVIVLPIGLPDDETLKDVSITSHSMEDYCLKLIELDKNLMNITLKSLVDDAKKANVEGSNKSKVVLQMFAIKKGMKYEDVIKYIVEHANRNILEKVIGTIKEALIT
ncbi:MAG: hypothetical protein QXD95_09085 [Nitrososphaeria archaeon]